jgi:hypothetical protein
MPARIAVARMLSGPDEWSRRRLQVLLAVAVAVIAAVVIGIVWSVIELVRGDHGSARAENAESAAAEQAWGDSAVDGAQPGALSRGSTGVIHIPQPRSLGQAQVATGFPKSTEGALAQLIAIDRRAIESGSVVTAQDVIAAWAAPGGPTRDSWSGVAAVQSLLEFAGLPANGSTELAIQLEPAMGLLQDETPTVCVDFVLSVTVRGGEPARIAVADCQRMTWTGDRWVIAAGDEATTTPSLWPGSQASYDAGYQWLEVEP